MVTLPHKTETAHLFELLSSVVDPEIPVLTLQDLGVLRDISIDDGVINVTITPTYAGCPAMQTMRVDIEKALLKAGHQQFNVKESLSPAWSTDWMTPNGREKLRAYGIAPPLKSSCDQSSGGIECPQCNSSEVKRISEFGSTACKALYQCQRCLEPFDYFKCI
jgi:ring-1,2-phenylacetyl-CoA epoxidase subunit PaaD